MEENEILTLPKGTVVKLRGFPLELAEDVKVMGHVEKEDGDEQKPDPAFSQEGLVVTQIS